MRHVFCLGSPHLGADLEKGANVARLGARPAAGDAAVRDSLNGRSVGIKDLRFGSCVEEDWRDCDPDEFLRDRCQEVPFLRRRALLLHRRDPLPRAEPLGALLGDLLVPLPERLGARNGKRPPSRSRSDNGRELAGMTHFDLLNHPAVYEQLRTWLEPAE